MTAKPPSPAPANSSAHPPATGLQAERVTVRYHAHQAPILDAQSLQIAPGQITILIGPNGSGKSTFLKTLAHQLAPDAGQILIDGRAINSLSRRDFARRLSIQFQENTAPDDLTVAELIRLGRYPHRRLFEPLDATDFAAIDQAIALAGIEPLRDRPILQLSSGQRQLAWIAMSLAQETPYLLLDEPTTFLDLEHQLDVMTLVARLKRDSGKTLILVLHDLSLAVRYADTLIAMRAGQVIATGPPVEVLSPAILREVFHIEAQLVHDDSGRLLACHPLRVLRPGSTPPAPASANTDSAPPPH